MRVLVVAFDWYMAATVRDLPSAIEKYRAAMKRYFQEYPNATKRETRLFMLKVDPQLRMHIFNRVWEDRNKL
jgi:hypothetical protein